MRQGIVSGKAAETALIEIMKIGSPHSQAIQLLLDSSVTLLSIQFVLAAVHLDLVTVFSLIGVT